MSKIRPRPARVLANFLFLRILARIPCQCTLRRVAFVWPVCCVPVACGIGGGGGGGLWPLPCCVPYLWRHRWRRPVENRQKENRRRKRFFFAAAFGLWRRSLRFACGLWHRWRRWHWRRPVAFACACAAFVYVVAACAFGVSPLAACGGGGVSLPLRL